MSCFGVPIKVHTGKLLSTLVDGLDGNAEGKDAGNIKMIEKSQTSFVADCPVRGFST